jgi:NAD(P)-dependent dehydrogenase (short-subunit alcohol dehydrogenase family)
MDNKRIVIVTGAAGGIGKAMLETLAAEGACLIGVDLPGSGISHVVTAFGEGHHGLECDLADEAQIVDLFARIDRIADHVDVLMNNAAMGPVMAPTLSTDAAHFRLTLQVNLVGPFLMAREAAKRMRPGGVIVNTASLAGVLGNPTRNAYAASKAGLISQTKSLACEWAPRGIRVSAIAPGYVRTPMVAALERDGKADLSQVRRRVPIGRLARADEMASAAAFLASDKARYITGAVLNVDGGWMSFNQPGFAHPAVDGAPEAELEKPEGVSGNSRVIVITGAARGIGAATAARFLEAGDRVVLVDRDRTDLDTSPLAGSPGATLLSADISSEEAVAGLFAEISIRLGHVDVLINNAAVADTFQPADAQTGADLARVLDVNLTGAFLCVRAALPLMQGRHAMIINLGSINTFLPFAPRHAYGSSKAGIDIFTRCLAAELGPSGIRSATLAPGYIRTPGVAELETTGKIDSLKIRQRIPMGDMGRPDDIADAAWFLASPAASYVNGAILYVDGGWTAFGAAGDASDPEAMDG